MFDKLKNSLTKVAGDLIGEDLGRLDAHGKALGDKAVHYVKTGDGGTVLATLSNTDIPHKLLFDRPFMAKTKTEPVLERRQEFFLDASPYDPALMARYGQVLAACRGKQGGDRGLAGPTMPIRRCASFSASPSKAR